MLRIAGIAAFLWATTAIASADGAKVLCTLVADATGTILLQEGVACGERVTPASTFKVPLAVMGFDSGMLKSAHEPVLPFKKGDPDWGGEAWRKPQDPSSWMTQSVVWYSQRITHHLGGERLQDYVRAFGYGNGDLSGDKGKNNGLDRSWISSSLKISPREQVRFIARLASGELPAKPDAMAKTAQILDVHAAAGWTIKGKTGSAYPRNADGTLNRARGWGWYVGWAERDDARLIVVRLRQDTRREEISGGLRTRASVLDDWSRLVLAALAQ
ncbi:MAG: class D beta-lactamase [Mesorhizobium sp.]